MFFDQIYLINLKSVNQFQIWSSLHENWIKTQKVPSVESIFVLQRVGPGGPFQAENMLVQKVGSIMISRHGGPEASEIIAARQQKVHGSSDISFCAD